MHLLIIEDDPTIRATLRDILEIHGHTVTEAADGPEGIKLAQQGQDLILCDIGIPGMDGFEVIKAVQQTDAGRNSAFIFLTARSSRDDHRLGMELGADDYITKPFTEPEILRAIESRVRRQKPLRDRLDALLAGQQRVAGANWSHQLMTPLTGVIGGLDLIAEEAGSLPVREIWDLLQIIRAGAHRQEILSRKLALHYELFQALSRKATTTEPCDACAAVAVGSNRAAEQQSRGRDLRLAAGPGLVAVDPGYLTSAVAEVVGNAFRFSHPGQGVDVTSVQEEGRYRIEVLDRGVGLTEEQCAQVQAFVQFDREKRPDTEGLGLGLAIAQSVAQLAGGSLVIKPRDSRSGLQVIFDLPCVEQPPGL